MRSINSSRKSGLIVDCWEVCTPFMVLISHWLQVCLVNPADWYSLSKWIHPQPDQNEFAGLVGITSVTVNKSSFLIYQLSVIALYVIYRRDKCYHHLANREWSKKRRACLRPLKSQQLKIWQLHAHIYDCKLSDVLVFSCWSQLLQGALVYK